jgi:hypothetical protein
MSETIYLMSRTDCVEAASVLARTKERIVSKAVSWYWGDLTKPNTGRLTIDVDLERLVVEVHDTALDEITTYYLFAFDRRVT